MRVKQDDIQDGIQDDIQDDIGHVSQIQSKIDWYKRVV
jgi:hypothetical protein